MVEAGGLFRLLKNTQVIDFLRCSKRTKRRNRAPLDRIWNVGFPHLGFLQAKDKEVARVWFTAASQRIGVLLPDNAGQALAESGS